MIEGLPPTVSDACPVCTMNPPHLLGLVFTEQERRPYTWRSKGSETPCQIITDLHEWRNNLSTVSEAVNMKSNWVCRCTPCTRRWDGKTLCTLTHNGGYEINDDYLVMILFNMIRPHTFRLTYQLMSTSREFTWDQCLQENIGGEYVQSVIKDTDARLLSLQTTQRSTGRP